MVVLELCKDMLRTVCGEVDRTASTCRQLCRKETAIIEKNSVTLTKQRPNTNKTNSYL